MQSICHTPHTLPIHLARTSSDVGPTVCPEPIPLCTPPFLTHTHSTHPFLCTGHPSCLPERRPSQSIPFSLLDRWVSSPVTAPRGLPSPKAQFGLRVSFPKPHPALSETKQCAKLWTPPARLCRAGAWSSLGAYPRYYKEGEVHSKWSTLPYRRSLELL